MNSTWEADGNIMKGPTAGNFPPPPVQQYVPLHMPYNSQFSNQQQHTPLPPHSHPIGIDTAANSPWNGDASGGGSYFSSCAAIPIAGSRTTSTTVMGGVGIHHRQHGGAAQSPSMRPTSAAAVSFIPSSYDQSTSADGGRPGSSSAPDPYIYRTRFGCPEDDLPIMQELGIYPSHITAKAAAVLYPFNKVSSDTTQDTDLAGPVVFAVSLGFLLSLQGKVQFSAIYTLSLLGVMGFRVLLGLMEASSASSVNVQLIVSTLGYCMIPNLLLAIIQTVLFWLIGSAGVMLPIAFIFITWSGWCASKMFSIAFGMEQQKYLILYPLLIFYSLFAALTIF
eukprot:Tbor_TRINITY_DN5650_c3_g7::TRINITY_DN5650_c3_g7_i1::g.9014::m.9014/K20363/YIP1, YIPF5; protein transport protein YIP1